MKHAIKMGVLALCLASLTPLSMAANMGTEPSQTAPNTSEKSPQSNLSDKHNAETTTTTKTMTQKENMSKENAKDTQSTMSHPEGSHAEGEIKTHKTVVKKTHKMHTASTKGHAWEKTGNRTHSGMTTTAQSSHQKSYVRGYW